MVGGLTSGGSGYRIRFDVSGDTQIDRSFMRMSTRVRDMAVVFEELAEEFLVMEEAQFESQGGFSGGWKPLTQSTLDAKAARGLDPRILHATLALRRSLTSRSAPGHVRHITPDTLEVGTEIKSAGGFPYAAVHQNPVSSPLPRRRPVEFDEEHRRDWMKRIQRYIVGEAGSAAYR